MGAGEPARGRVGIPRSHFECDVGGDRNGCQPSDIPYAAVEIGYHLRPVHAAVRGTPYILPAIYDREVSTTIACNK